ncbi:replication protein [Butyricicoccus faecihominis]|uniref:replication protein n=1 Tax=Butyricicoccus faecihominis TaxID=1712515 RepID=UPI00247A1442|nr:replication protein [Butyricicoccus faecihominis]MCQ5129970.1 replication protein [Butyricicoccus faecihominis]
MSDTQCRKWQLTINHPQEKGFTHEKISTELQALKPIVYYCMADEIGQTYHTHIFAAFSSSVRFSTLKARFPEAHLEAARGTPAQNRDYIAKSGKWENDTKHGTRIPGTFEEWGEIPEEQPGRRTDLADLYEMIKSGATDIELLEAFPKAMLYLDKIERVRQTLKAERYATEFRPLEVTYLWGPTGTGKTRSVMEKYGYDRVCRVTDYDHPFERYAGEDVLVFDEFRSQLRISDMLNYLDGYPLMLPCRYANKQACYTKVYLISNVALESQYRNIQYDEPATWQAFTRRIHRVEYLTAPADHDFIELTDTDTLCPF